MESDERIDYKLDDQVDIEEINDRLRAGTTKEVYWDAAGSSRPCPSCGKATFYNIQTSESDSFRRCAGCDAAFECPTPGDPEESPTDGPGEGPGSSTTDRGYLCPSCGEEGIRLIKTPDGRRGPRCVCCGKAFEWGVFTRPEDPPRPETWRDRPPLL